MMMLIFQSRTGNYQKLMNEDSVILCFCLGEAIITKIYQQQPKIIFQIHAVLLKLQNNVMITLHKILKNL